MSLLIAGVLVAASGCAGFHRPLAATGQPEADEMARLQPQPVKNRVHVLFVHGHDPLDLASLGDLRQHAIGLGFIKTYAGAPFQASALADAAQEAQRLEPEARFVLVGHGTGCASLAALASRIQRDGSPVDAVVALSPGDAALPQGGNLVAVVRAGEAVPAAAESHVVDAWPFHLPTHPRTQAVLALKLAASAGQVALLEEKRGPVFAVASGEWDLLRCEAKRSERCMPIIAARQMSPAGLE